MNMLRELKWAAQRVYRGWDDRVIWDIGSHLAKSVPVWLSQLKAQQWGVPPLVYDGNDVDLEASGKKWDEIIDKIIEGFRAAQRINDLPVWDELHEEEQKRFGRLLLPWDEEDVKELNKLYDELDFWKKYREQLDEAALKFQQGMPLFTEHFFSLWS